MLRRLPAPALVLAVMLVAVGCSTDRSPATAPTRAARPSYSGLVASRMHVVRVHFCDLVPARDLVHALGGAPAAATSWGNGAPIPTVAGADVSHELGCGWTGPTGVVARAWVFARPVTSAFAASIMAEAARQHACSARPNAVFGHPATTQTCSGPARSLRVRIAGLFGDTWLSCELEQPHGSAATIVVQTEDWCAAVASALDTAG